MDQYGYIDVMLRGKKMKQFAEHRYAGIRNKYGLRQVEIEALMYLEKHPDANSSLISRSLLINKGLLSLSMDHLVKKKLVISKPDANDRRSISFTLTAQGKAIVDECAALRSALAKRVLAGVTPEEIEVLCRVSLKLCENIERIEQAGMDGM